MPWKRPRDVPVGRVWSRFKGKERHGAPAIMYQIRDLEEPYREQCLDMMQETFIRDEPVCQFLGISSDSELIKTIRNNWDKLLSQQVTLACFTEQHDEPKELVGLNILRVMCKGDVEEADAMNIADSWRQCINAVEKMADAFEYYKVDKYLTSNGLAVLPEHRGQNIGARLLEARKDLCKAFGIKATCTVFSAKTSQVLAAKCNYEVLTAASYEEMKKCGVDLTGCGTEAVKVMGRMFQEG